MNDSRRWRTLVALLALLALLGAACGGDDDDGDDAGPDTTEEHDPDGVIRVAANLSNDAGIRFDPIAMLTGQSVYSYPVLGGWLKRDAEGVFQPDLAEEVTVVDPTTIEVELKEDLTFSNGETLDAAAAKASIDRNIVSGNSAGLRVAELALIESVVVDGPTTFTINLKSPSIALFYPLLADAELAPVAPASAVSTDKTAKTVIGAGPFKIDSYDVGVQAVMSKNENYYDADNVLLAGIRWIHAESPTAVDTAMRSNTVDYAGSGQAGLTVAQASQLPSPIEVVYDRQAAPQWLNMCARAGSPLDDLDVRKALNHAVDREAVNALVYGGNSEPAWALAPSDTPLGNEDTDEAYPHDADTAADLLADAGYGEDNPLSLTLVYDANQERLALLLQSQLAEAGVTLNLRITQNIAQDWYQNPAGDLNVVPMIREGVSRLTRLVTTEAFANVCDQARPEIDSITQQLVQLDPTDPEAAGLWDDVNEVFVENAYGVPLVWSVVPFAYNGDTVGELPTMTDSIMTQRPDYSRAWMRP